MFLYMVWEHLGLPKPTPAQYALASRLQHGPDRDIIQAFRGVGKSWITVTFSLWTLARDAKTKIEVVSASQSLSQEFSTFCFQLLYGMPLLAPLMPEKGQRDSKLSFDVSGAGASKDPSVKSVGIFGQITGTRADLIVADDCETPKTAQTIGSREKLAEAVKEFDAILKPKGQIKYLGTPQTQDTLYKKLVDERGYSTWIWPARFPTVAQWDVYGMHLADELHQRVASYSVANNCSEEAAREALAGSPTDAVRFDDDDLTVRELSYGKKGFQLQFMLDPSLADAEKYPLKLADLVVQPIDDEVAPDKIIYGSSPDLAFGHELPNLGFNGDRFYRPIGVSKEFLSYTDRILSVDPAGRGKDETAVAALYFLNSYIHLPEIAGIQGGYSEAVLCRIKEMAYKHRVTKILVESNFGDGMFVALLKPILNKETYTEDGRTIPPYPVAIEEVRATVQKEKRIIDTLEPVMARHRLIVDPRVVQYDYDSIQGYDMQVQSGYSLFYQMTRVTDEKGCLVQDDRLDCLAQGVSYFTERMHLDEDKMAEGRRERAQDEAMKRFRDSQIGLGYAKRMAAKKRHSSGLGKFV